MLKMKAHFKKLIPVYILVLACFLIIGAGGSKALQVFSEISPISRKIVVIDAGHGGVDGGATSCRGVLESTINLNIALKLKEVMHLLGIKTVMIRESDISVYTEGTTIAAKKVSDLKERVRLVNDSNASLLISIHQNYFQAQQFQGPQIFYASSDGSAVIGKAMQLQLNQSLAPQCKRAAMPADKIYLMQHIRCPGFLIECGFLSNPEEEARLRDHDYQNKLCTVLAVSCSKYLHQEAVT